MNTDYPRSSVTAIVLAGGEGKRLGGVDKGLAEVAGRPMIEHVMDAVRPQCATVVISANRNLERYRTLGCTVVPDAADDFPGPLAGILAGLAATATPYALVVPCDAPLLPRDLGPRLYTALRETGARLAVVHDGERLQPLFLLMETGLAETVEACLAAGRRRVDRWVEQQHPAVVDFAAEARAFTNVNAPADLKALADRLLAEPDSD